MRGTIAQDGRPRGARRLRILARMFPDRRRLQELLAREEERFAAAHPRSRELSERARGSWLAGVPMHWMVRWAGGFPVFVAEASGARFTDVDGHSVSRPLPRRHGRDDRPCAAGDRRGRRRAGAARDDVHAADRGRRVARRGAGPALRPALLAGGADGDRRQPLRDPPRPAPDAAAEDPGLQLVLPRHGRRGLRHAFGRRGPGARRQPRAAGRSGGDHTRRRVQRRRRARGRPRARRRRVRPRGARPDQHRDRASGARIPRGRCARRRGERGRSSSSTRRIRFRPDPAA